MSYKNHLRKDHASFFPEVLEIPSLKPNSPFSLYQTKNFLETLGDSENISPNDIFEPPSPQISATVVDDKTEIEMNKHQFLDLLVQNGIKYNIPFKALQSLSSSLINFFSDLNDKGQCSEELVYSLKQSVSSSGSFDYNLETCFNAVFPEIIDIFGSDCFFGYMPLKKSIFYLVSKFMSFKKFTISSSSETDSINSFFTSKFPKKVNCIYINVFVDDFQQAKPLLRKKTERNNSLTGIYYRIITTDNFHYSHLENIFPIVLVKTKTFKQHMASIFQYIGNEVSQIRQSGI